MSCTTHPRSSAINNRQLKVEIMEGLLEKVMADSVSPAARVLLADDQPEVLEALQLLLKCQGYEVERAESPAGVIELLRTRPFDAVLMDMNYARDTTSGWEGLDLLSQVESIDPDLPVLVMTAWSSVHLAVEAMRRGVRDFFEKPWENGRLLSTLREQVGHGRAQREQRRQEEFEAEEIRRIGQRLLPHDIPLIPGYQISGVWQPFGKGGGDYFDIVKFKDHAVAFAIADVVGKGVPAGLVMSNLQAAVKANVSEQTSPGQLPAKLHQLIRENLGPDILITFFYGVLDVPGRRLVYSNADHNPPILIHQDGSTARLETGGPLLGAPADSAYEQDQVELRPGDLLTLFTDGLTEASDTTKGEFGEDRLIAFLAENRRVDVEVLQRKVLNAVRDFTHASFQDDATLLLIKTLQLDDSAVTSEDSVAQGSPFSPAAVQPNMEKPPRQVGALQTH